VRGFLWSRNSHQWLKTIQKDGNDFEDNCHKQCCVYICSNILMFVINCTNKKWEALLSD
jgi:hypothetical protein